MQRRSGGFIPLRRYPRQCPNDRTRRMGPGSRFAWPGRLVEVLSLLSPQRSLRVYIQRVDRLARCHEQPVALQSAETQISAALGQRDAADQYAVGRIDDNAVQLRITHAP